MSLRLLFVLIAIFFCYYPAEAKDIDWSKISSHKVPMFYPGVASWEFLTSEDHKLGGNNIKQGKKSCPECHLSKSGEFDLRADDIASGKLRMKKSQKAFEPEPLSGKKGFINLSLQTAYDEEYIYMRLQWESTGASWNNPKIAEDGFADRVAVQLNRTQDFFKRYGCFIACHSDLNSMPASPSKDEVRKHPYYSSLKREDVRLYAYYARDNGWAAMKGDDVLKRLLNEGGLIDLWETEFKGMNAEAEDGWIFNDRRGDDKADVKSDAKWGDGKYAVVLKRKLNTGDSQDVQLKEDEKFAIGVAIHDNKANHRKHYISFPLTIGLGVKGDIKAEKVK
ncbi:MAG: hypothetical protein A2090_10180 [Deltaproteobacteria bacterium GWD2_42_10]|nr:MAG: hypothetical protein A2090_10180 [Deltaproteobacteria bacterium GWD2_42_10]